MNKAKKAYILEDMAKTIPDAPLSFCLDIAQQIVSGEYEVHFLKIRLALLGEALGMDSNGKFPDQLIQKFAKDKPILSALDAIQNCHGWIVCGPSFDSRDSMEVLKERVAKELTGKRFFQSVLNKE